MGSVQCKTKCAMHTKEGVRIGTSISHSILCALHTLVFTVCISLNNYNTVHVTSGYNNKWDYSYYIHENEILTYPFRAVFLTPIAPFEWACSQENGGKI